MKTASSPSSRSTTLLRWSGTFVALGILVWLLWRQGWDEVAASFRRIELWRVALALGLMVVSRLAVTARWHVLLRSAGVKTSFGQTARLTFAGLFASNVLPTSVGGDIVRLGGGLRMGFDPAITLSSLVVDRLVGMAAYAMAVPLGLPAFIRHLPEIVPRLKETGLAGAPLAAAVSRTTWRDKAVAAVRRTVQAFELWLHKPAALLLALASSWVRMACDFLIAALLLAGMGEPLPLALIAGLWSIVYFVTLFPVSINGIGWQELSATLLFSLIGGVSAASAGVLALFLRLLPMLVSLPGALFVGDLIAGQKASR